MLEKIDKPNFSHTAGESKRKPTKSINYPPLNKKNYGVAKPKQRPR